MNNPHDEGNILELVRNSLADVLGRPVSDVPADASLINQLGAESLDFLDLTHKLETRLNVELPKLGILDHAEARGDSGPVYREDGKLSELGHYLLKNSFYRFTPEQIGIDASPASVMSSATPQNWSSLCYHLFSYLPARCQECSGSEAEVAPDGRTVCVGCRAPVRPPAGDDVLGEYVVELLRRWGSEQR